MKLTNYTTGIQHLGIPTNNMKKTLEFYEKLGFEIAYSTVLGDKNFHFLKLGNLCVEVYDNPDAAMCWGGIDHVAIDVTDVQAVYKQICEMGLNTLNDEIHELPFWTNGVKFFKIEGPNKEIIEFSQYL